ncbi:MAG TPA: aspartate dehydrogenase domain-containing protein [bacterium]|nr:aspartate dehydrogenase domain-containing protein [bacterium]
MKRRLGLVGCGAIGSTVARLLEKRRSSFVVTGLYDVSPAQAQKLSKRLKSRPRVFDSPSDLVGHVDWVLEAASVKAVPALARMALQRRKPLVAMSSGGVLGHFAEISRLAEKYRTKVYLPSGALAGLDGVRAARQLGKINKITITSTKPPRGFAGAPGLTAAQKKALYSSRKAFYLYQGDVWGAIRRFPANVNVSATLALASGNPKLVKVKVMADPKARLNQHQVEVAGAFGQLTAVTRNQPSAENPKTSALAIQAALALFERLERFVEIGN